MKLVTVEPIGAIGAFPFCDVDCCGGRGVFELRGEGHAFFGGTKKEVYRACEGDQTHLGRLTANMIRHAPGATVTVTRAIWATPKKEATP